MAIPSSSVDSSSVVINTTNNNVMVVNMPTPVDADADAVSKLLQLALGGIGVGTFSAGSAGAAYRDKLLAGVLGPACEVAFFVILAAIYFVSVGQMLAAARCLPLDGTTAKNITVVSYLLLLVLIAFGLVSYYLLSNH